MQLIVVFLQLLLLHVLTLLIALLSKLTINVAQIVGVLKLLLAVKINLILLVRPQMIEQLAQLPVNFVHTLQLVLVLPLLLLLLDLP